MDTGLKVGVNVDIQRTDGKLSNSSLPVPTTKKVRIRKMK